MFYPAYGWNWAIPHAEHMVLLLTVQMYDTVKHLAAHSSTVKKEKFSSTTHHGSQKPLVILWLLNRNPPNYGCSLNLITYNDLWRPEIQSAIWRTVRMYNKVVTLIHVNHLSVSSVHAVMQSSPLMFASSLLMSYRENGLSLSTAASRGNQHASEVSGFYSFLF